MVAQIIPIHYEIFRNATSALDSDGGPWFYEGRWPNIFQGTRFVPWCEGNCIHIYTDGVCESCASAFSLLANVTVDMNDYPGATSLSYNWEYSPAMCDALSAIGEVGEISLVIGDQVMSDSISSVPCPDSISENSPGWSGNPLTHSGNTTLLQFKSTGYIPINITLLKTDYDSNKDLTWYFKGIHFEITTPVGGALGPPLTPPKKSNVAAIIPAVVVPVVATLIVSLALFFWNKRRKNPQIVELEIGDKRLSRLDITGSKGTPTHHPDDNAVIPFRIAPGPAAGSPALSGKFHPRFTPLTQHQMDSRLSMAPTTSSPSGLASNSATTSQSSSIHLGNVGNGGNRQYPRGPGAPSIFSQAVTLPPAYIDPESSQYREGSRSIDALLMHEGPNLAEFANMNRDLIPEELESKLMHAGYIPSDDPNSFTEDEWRKLYGVSRLELARVKELNRRWKTVTRITSEEPLS